MNILLIVFFGILSFVSVYHVIISSAALFMPTTKIGLLQKMIEVLYLSFTLPFSFIFCSIFSSWGSSSVKWIFSEKNNFLINFSVGDGSVFLVDKLAFFWLFIPVFLGVSFAIFYRIYSKERK